MKPNIFRIATKELSQDGFFTWVLQWADKKNGQYDQQLNEIKPYAEKNDLVISKPDKYRTGTTSTLAIVHNAFTIDNDGEIEFDKVISTLKKSENVLDGFCKDKETQQITGVRQQRAKSTVPVSPLSPSTKTLPAMWRSCYDTV